MRMLPAQPQARTGWPAAPAQLRLLNHSCAQMGMLPAQLQARTGWPAAPQRPRRGSAKGGRLYRAPARPSCRACLPIRPWCCGSACMQVCCCCSCGICCLIVQRLHGKQQQPCWLPSCRGCLLNSLGAVGKRACRCALACTLACCRLCCMVQMPCLVWMCSISMGTTVPHYTSASPDLLPRSKHLHRLA